MKKFLITGFVFGLSIVLVNCFLHYFYVKHLMRETILFKKEAEYQQNKDSIKILFLGDSHVETGFNPFSLKNSFNYSSAGESYILTYFKLKHLLKNKNSSLQTIVLPLDLHSFSPFRIDNINNDAYWVNLADYFEIGGVRDNRLFFATKYFSGRFAAYIGNFKEIYLALKEKNSPNKEKKSVMGFTPRQGSLLKSNRVEEISNRVNYHFFDSTYLDPTLLTYFQKTLQLCMKKRLNVILIKYPVTKEYFETATGKIEISNYDRKIEQIIEPYKNSLIIIDYQKYYFKNSDYFLDADHLNEKGAQIFSEELYQNFKELRANYVKSDLPSGKRSVQN